eukprot:m.243945 g.243945  ORF g.243945 m.243945 type:complete len:86 (-) comp17463_c0_seq71:2835-3092(-)
MRSFNGLVTCAIQDKDYLNNRYLFKRALYLQHIAQALQGYDGVTDVHYALFNVRCSLPWPSRASLNILTLVRVILSSPFWSVDLY